MDRLGIVVPCYNEEEVLKISSEALRTVLDDLVAKKIKSSTVKRLKQVKTKALNAKKVKMLEDALLSIMMYGGEVGEGINLEVPDDETKLEELELVFEAKYKNMPPQDLKKEVKDLLSSYQKEVKQQKIEELSAELEKCEDDEEKSADILREIQKIQKG